MLFAKITHFYDMTKNIAKYFFGKEKQTNRKTYRFTI